MKTRLFFPVLIIALFVISCSNKSDSYETIVKGHFTITDSLAENEDYSGIGIVIFDPDSAISEADTMLYLVTDTSGYFEGTIQFPEKKFYGMAISRDNKLIDSFGAILANGDTLTINGELPNLEQTLVLNSREHKALKTFNRVDAQFQRVSEFIRKGAIADSMIAFELKKWSNLYWEVFEKNENTFASYLSAEKSVDLLSGWDNENMIKRINRALPADYFIPVAVRLGVPYYSESKGFEATSGFLDSLSQLTDNNLLKELLLRDKIKLHFDSSRVKAAKALLVDYEEEYNENNASQDWAKRIRYDLNFLAPGVEAPEFEFITLAGDSVSKQKLDGQVYILEISPLANAEYQNDLDRTIVIHEIYKNYGLKIFTIPLDSSPLTVDAFFDERPKVWPVAEVGTFDVQKIVEKFNVTQVPTRLLVGHDGKLIRKYVRDEFQDVIEGLNQAFSDKKNPSL